MQSRVRGGGNTMRRVGTMGRFRSGSAAEKSVDALAAASSSRNAGLDYVLQCLAEFRRAGRSGAMKVGPRDCFDLKKAWWLYEPEEVDR